MIALRAFRGTSPEFKIDKLSATARGLIGAIDTVITKEAYADLYRRAGAEEPRASALVPSKTEVFISYRSPWEARAKELFHALGEYESRTVFIPRYDKVDMQAGSWIRQLEEMIGRAKYFVPLLTPDYREGPVARHEVEQAMRESFAEREDRRIVPVLIAGYISD